MAYIDEMLRSERSQEAIENFRVPDALINNETLNDFFANCLSEGIIDAEDYIYLQRFKSGLWKYVARECTDTDEWHHFGRYYSKSKHYDLNTILIYILTHKDTIVRDYIKYKINENKKRPDFRKFPICKFGYNVWDKNKKHPRIISVEYKMGVDDGRGVYFIQNGKVHRKKWSGNNVYRHAEKKYEELTEKEQKSIDAVYEYLKHCDVLPDS